MSGRRTASIAAAWAAAVAAEALLFLTYQAHEARFHWFTHFYAGGSVALVAMAIWRIRTGSPVRRPLMWPILFHVVAMFPDFLFAFGIAHRRWMDVFLGHLSIHFVPGRNWTWYLIFLCTLAGYLISTVRPGAAAKQRSVER